MNFDIYQRRILDRIAEEEHYLNALRLSRAPVESEEGENMLMRAASRLHTVRQTCEGRIDDLFERAHLSDHQVQSAMTYIQGRVADLVQRDKKRARERRAIKWSRIIKRKRGEMHRQRLAQGIAA